MVKSLLQAVCGGAMLAGAALAVSGPALAQDQRPDFSGVWTSAANPTAPPSAAARRGELPLTEEGRRRVEEYQQLIRPVLASSPTGTGSDNPGAYCVTYGMPSMMLSVGAYPIEFIQRPEQLTFISSFVTAGGEEFGFGVP